MVIKLCVSEIARTIVNIVYFKTIPCAILDQWPQGWDFSMIFPAKVALRNLPVEKHSMVGQWLGLELTDTLKSRKKLNAIFTFLLITF